MKKKLNIILSVSGHLPSGADEAEFEALYNTKIRPLVQALNKFPRINVVFHYSGVVLYWIERRHPELFMLLEDLLSRKQAEFLGGGFYHPVLPLLPPADKIGQIEMLTTYLRKHFGKRPQGCWIPAMTWEQNLVGPLNSCGMNYTFLDDYQFAGAGVKPGDEGVFSPCVSEDQGKLITVFPLARAASRELRKGKAILEDFLTRLPLEEDPLIVLPLEEEGEGFEPEPAPGAEGISGVSSVEYERLFEELSGADPRIEYTSPAKVYKNLRRLNKVYFPGICPRKAGNGTHPRQFLADHPEAGGIYAKTIHVHTLINNKLRGDKTRKRTALEELWKAQDSGIFRPGTSSAPGLRDSRVRNAAYRSLLEAEKITREKGKFTPALSFFDFDLDGEGEYIFQDDKLNCCIKSRGAGIFELDYLSGAWNYLDTFSQNPENPGGGERRRAFTDWLGPAETLPEAAGPAGIPGGFFCGAGEYEVSEMERVRRRLCFRLPPRPGSPWGEIEIEKTWQLKKNSLAVDYVLKNTGTGNTGFVFSPSIDLSFPGEGEAFLRIFAPRESGKEGIVSDAPHTVSDMKVLEFQDIANETVIVLESSRSCSARIFHIHSGPGEYQSTCVMPLLPFSLEGGKSVKAAFSLRISS